MDTFVPMVPRIKLDRVNEGESDSYCSEWIDTTPSNCTPYSTPAKNGERKASQSNRRELGNEAIGDNLQPLRQKRSMIDDYFEVLSDSARSTVVKRRALLEEMCQSLFSVISWFHCLSIYRWNWMVELLAYILATCFGLFGAWSASVCFASFSSELSFDSSTIARFAIVIHFLHCVAGTYYLCRTRKCWSRFLERWLEVNWAAKEEYSPIIPLKWAGLSCKLYVCFGTLLFLLLLCAAKLNLVIGFPDNCDCFIPHLPAPTTIVNTIMLTIATIPNLHMQGVYATLCCLLVSEYRHFERLFKNRLLRNSSPEEDLAEYRKQHFQVMRLTDLVDEMYSYYTYLMFILNLPVICALVYAKMLDENMSASDQIGMTVWLVFYSVHILVITVPASVVCYQAHQPLETIQEFANSPPQSVLEAIQTSARKKSSLLRREQVKHYWVSDEYYIQITLFMNQVTSRTIGITCAGFFFLSKQFMLTLISVLITYFTLMLQMDISASSVCECDCGVANQNNTMLLFR